MYITSEARMKKERVRERRTGQKWRDGYKHQMVEFNWTDEESTVRKVGKEKTKNYRTGKSTAVPGGLPTTQCGDDSFWSFSDWVVRFCHFHPPVPSNTAWLIKNAGKHWSVWPILQFSTVKHCHTPKGWETTADTSDTPGHKSEGTGRTRIWDSVWVHDRKHEN